MDFVLTDIKGLRSRIREINIGRQFTRTYNMPAGSLDPTLLPATARLPQKGDVQPGYGDESWETEVLDELKPHITNIEYVKDKQGALRHVRLTFTKADSFA